MAYDPEARETGNSAMVIGIIVLVLLVGGALAYFATRPGEVVAPVVVDQDAPPTSTTTIIEDNQPAPITNDNPDTIIVQPAPEVETRSETTVTTETTTEGAADADIPAGDTGAVDTGAAEAPVESP